MMSLMTATMLMVKKLSANTHDLFRILRMMSALGLQSKTSMQAQLWHSATKQQCSTEYVASCHIRTYVSYVPTGYVCALHVRTYVILDVIVLYCAGNLCP